MNGQNYKIYYAHCIKDYGTEKAEGHKNTLRSLGFQVVDPSSDFFVSKVREMRSQGKSSKEVMNFFLDEVKKYQYLAFSVADNGKVSAGVWKEINTMKKNKGMIIQMPDFNSLRPMSIKETQNHIL